MDDILSLHKEEFGVAAEAVASAPATVNIFGEHTDLTDGLVMEGALDRSLSVAVSRRSDNSLRFYAADLNERKRTTLQNLKYRREDRWANYPKGVLYELMQLGYEFSGFELTVSSDIPPGIGLGASAAFGVASAIALSQLFAIELSEFQIVQSAAMAELSFIGVETSLTDHLVSTVARENAFVFVDLRELSYDYVPVDLTEVRLIVTVSNVPHVSPGRELSLRRKKCAECVSLLREYRLGGTLRDVAAAELRDTLGGVPEDIRRLCTHVAAENEGVLRAKRALEQNDYSMFGKLMSRSHDSLRDNYEVSCPEIDWLVKRAVETPGVLGSKMSGPGFGGCTLSLVRASAVDTYLESIDGYERIFGFKPKTFVMSPASGAGRTPSLARR